MQVGDLIRTISQYNLSYGIILQADGKQVQCLWGDGDVSWCYTWQLDVMNEI